MIEIVNTFMVRNPEGQIVSRACEIIISNGGGQSYLWSVGGLPLEGDLQAILNAREAELFAAAQAGGRVVDLYELNLKRVVKACALVILDEINILRQRAGLTPRTAGMIDDAIKGKLKGMG
jgi:hypothetical protein